MTNPQNESNEPTVKELFDLTGKVSLITGASGLLGSSLARALAEAGSRVVVTSRQADRAQQTARSLPDPFEVNHLGIVLDHLDEASIERGFEEIVEQTGRIDVLVNNGHAGLAADLTTVTESEFNRQLGNLTGYFLLARRTRDFALGQASSASIIMLGSMYGLVSSYPDAYQDLMPASPVAYHALKGGIIHLTRHLAVYWAQDRVRVNCLSPGPFPRPTVADEFVKRLESHSPMRRMGQPYELKGAVVFLASNASSYVTGQNLIVDGGWTAC